MLDIFAAFVIGQPDSSPFWLFLFFFFGTFISEDVACLLAGASVAAGHSTFVFAVSACLAGIFVGDLLLYGVGRIVGSSIFRLTLIRRFVSESNLSRTQTWLNKNGAVAVFTSRFISGLRLPTYLAAGALKAEATRFALYCFLAAAIWTPILVGIAAFSLSWVSPGTIALTIILLLIFARLIFKLTSWKNRRLALGRIKRITNWEFWPLTAFYFPVVCYVLYLGAKYRSFTLFTAANPDIPAGGFVGESKDEIYSMIKRSSKAIEHCLRHVKIQSASGRTKRLVAAVSFIVKNQLRYPLVLKPDHGERGHGVTIVRNPEQLAIAIGSAKRDMILQEYVEGVEASVFYYRFPNSKRGHIFSITEKIFPAVVGNGDSTLEELILRDPRAVCMTKSYFRHHAGNLSDRPPKGERAQLIDIGTHSRGAIFKDGQWLQTLELADRIDDICCDVPGFYFGRFDVRAASFDELRRGKFKIIELNGVSSESTNIYDPKYSLFDAYRILFRQWRLAFAIANANKELGHLPITLSQFIKLIATRDASHITVRDSDKLSGVNPTKACA